MMRSQDIKLAILAGTIALGVLADHVTAQQHPRPRLIEVDNKLRVALMPIS